MCLPTEIGFPLYKKESPISIVSQGYLTNGGKGIPLSALTRNIFLFNLAIYLSL